jgi:ATP-binding cassette subfamily B protein
MTSTTPSASRPVIPDAWLLEVKALFLPDENVSAFLEVDLNKSLKFAKTALILTDQRLLTRFEDQKNWQSWDLKPHLTLKLSDHAGVGSLELSDGAQRLAVWRFTLGLQAAAARMAGQLALHQSQQADGVPLQKRLSGSVCPVCQAVMSEDDEECTSCGLSLIHI